MWKSINPPGDWGKFLKRKDIVGLPIMEARKIYLKEQVDYDNFVSSQQSIIKGGGVKGPHTTTQPFVAPPSVPLRYNSYVEESCIFPEYEMFPQDFGDKYVESFEDIDWFGEQGLKINFKPGASTGLGSTYIVYYIYGYNSVLHNNQPWSWEIVPEFQGRNNVLKITVPPGLTVQKCEPRIDVGLPYSLNRVALMDTHAWSMASGLWPVDTNWNGSYVTNNVAALGGSADLLQFLAQLTPTNPENTFGAGFDWFENQWNDERTTSVTIFQGPSLSLLFPVGYTRAWYYSELKSLDPVTLYGPEFVFYFSDFNFRICRL